MNDTAKNIWRSYTNGTGSGVTRLLVTIFVSIMGFMSIQLAQDIRQRFGEIGEDIRYLSQNIVPRNEFHKFRDEMKAKCDIFSEHVAKDEYRWIVRDINSETNEKPRRNNDGI